MAQPQTFLVQILITIKPDGSQDPNPQYRSFYDPANTRAEHLRVNVGDHVGWLVQVVIGHNRRAVAYTLDFSQNAGFFGTQSLAVPAGGLSPFLRVLSLQGKVKYSVRIPGLNAIDPDIQSGGDTTLDGMILRTGTAYAVYWDTAHPGNPMTYTGGNGPGQLPLTVSVGDVVTFHANVSGTPAVSNFEVDFAGNGWASPFDPDNGTFRASGSSTVITPPKPVGDSAEPDVKFPFTAYITLNNQAVHSTNPNNELVMAKP